jgi:hypothetical protein
MGGFRSSGAADNPLQHDVIDARESAKRDFRERFRTLRCPARERGAGGPADDDPAHHAGMLMRDAEEIVDSLHGERDAEGLVRQQIIGVPRDCAGRDPERAIEVLRVIGGRRVGVSGIPVDSPDDLARLDPDSYRIEPDIRAIGIPLHPDLDRPPGPEQARRRQTGEESSADLQHTSP